jgi:hypothetical protein
LPPKFLPPESPKRNQKPSARRRSLPPFTETGGNSRTNQTPPPPAISPPKAPYNQRADLIPSPNLQNISAATATHASEIFFRKTQESHRRRDSWKPPPPPLCR